ncbi:MAG: type II secretion system minor pseudopilin GspJ [Alphaproteobacteria bacterium]|nr:type II secretion system minor pseudopilin GspJ [Alphaproteobacteria bacterium]
MRQGGFTLVELLVGLAIFGLMASAGTALLAGSVNASVQATQLADAAGALARTHALITADVAQAAPRPWRDEQGQPHPAFSSGDGALFTLVRRGWANPGQAARASLQRISWRIENGALVRRAAPMLDGPALGDAAVLLAGITSATIRIHDGRGWQSGWANPDPAALPRALEISASGPDIGRIRLLVPLGPGGPP